MLYASTTIKATHHEFPRSPQPRLIRGRRRSCHSGGGQNRAAGKTAPRLTPADIDAAITAEDYYVFPGTTVTVCCLTLRNGFNTIGYSAAASPSNFDERIGRNVAHRNAREKIWSLEGYLLKERLHQGTEPTAGASLSASPNIVHRHENIQE